MLFRKAAARLRPASAGCKGRQIGQRIGRHRSGQHQQFPLKGATNRQCKQAKIVAHAAALGTASQNAAMGGVQRKLSLQFFHFSGTYRHNFAIQRVFNLQPQMIRRQDALGFSGGQLQKGSIPCSALLRQGQLQPQPQHGGQTDEQHKPGQAQHQYQKVPGIPPKVENMKDQSGKQTAQI